MHLEQEVFIEYGFPFSGFYSASEQDPAKNKLPEFRINKNYGIFVYTLSVRKTYRYYNHLSVNNTEYVILVDGQDNETGSMEKMEAHEKGLLHRAFSVFIFNTKGELLLQQRAASKYHSPLKWTNTCCSHQRKGESTLDAAKRRLKEEMGIECDVRTAYTFVYKADVGQGLTEHEFDHVLIGYFDEKEIPFNHSEVQAFRYVSLEEIEKELEQNPEQFTKWFQITFKDLKTFVQKNS